MRIPVRALYVGALLFSVGCLESSLTRDGGAGADSGPGFDAGPGRDGGPGFDGGPGRDAGPGGPDVPVEPPICRPHQDEDCMLTARPTLLVLPSTVIQNTLFDLAGVEVELPSFTRRDATFEGPGVINEASLSTVLEASNVFATQVRDQVQAMCSGDEACRLAASMSIIETLWRRPLAAVERDTLATMVRTDEGLVAALRQAVLAPDFLVIFEDGRADSLSERERLFRFAIAILRTVPPLSRLEALGRSTSPIAELFQDPASQRGLSDFHSSLLATRDTGDLPGLYPKMLQEQSEFVRHVLAGPTPEFGFLFGSPYTTLDAELAMHYGLDAAGLDDEFREVHIDSPRAGGLLTQGAFTTGPSRIGRRAVVIAQNVLCRNLPASPPEIEPLPMGMGTEREQWEAAVAGPTCQGCHQLFDTFGFGLLNYDEEGLYREEEGGLPVDASFAGVCFGPEDFPPAGEGPEALTEWIATSVEAHDCYGRQWNTFIGFTDFGVCTADAINHQPGDSIIDMLQRSFDNDDLHPRAPGRRPVLDPYEFREPSVGDDPTIQLLLATRRRVDTFDQSVSSEGDERIIEDYRSALLSLELRLAR